MVQWRDKHTKTSQQTVMAVRGLCRAAGVPFLVNDDVALAKAIGADGVHLGHDDMDPHNARAILGEQALVGLSVGSDEEAKRYDPQMVDYVGVGPVFPTATHDSPSPSRSRTCNHSPLGREFEYRTRP